MQKKRKKTIKIDVDGVIRDIVTTMCNCYNGLFGTDMTTEDVVLYNVNNLFPKIREKYGIEPSEFFFDRLSHAVFESVSKPFEGVSEAIGTLMEHGYKAVIVTWQFSKANKIHTLNFLERYNIPYDDICFTKDKWMIKGDYLIDDNPEFITDKRDKSEKILVDAAYNRKLSKNYTRVKSLKEAVEYIISKENKIKKAA